MGERLNEGHWVAVLWRRRWIVALTAILFVISTEVATATLTRIYSTGATLIIAQPGRVQSFDTTQADEEAARSYAAILASQNFADRVASALGGGSSGAAVASEVTIQPAAQTQLLTITAQDPSPTRAKRIADTYASIFVRYAPALESQTKASATLADPAPLPTSPVRPKPLLYGLVAVLLGLAGGVALAFLRERFDVRIRTLDELGAHLELPIFAAIPTRTGDSQTVRGFAEAFRLLRTNLQVLDVRGPVRTIAVTSWAPGEGKTTVASQLALRLAATGTSTLIIDGDAQRPALGDLLGPRDAELLEPGLSDYILGSSSAEDAIHETRVAMLSLMPPGTQVPNLSSLLDTPRGREAFAALRDTREVVLIDCAPLAVGADASTIGARVDGVILVVDLSHATTTALRKALRRVEAANGAIIGVVANRDSASGSVAYYGYGETPDFVPRWAVIRFWRRARGRSQAEG